MQNNILGTILVTKQHDFPSMKKYTLLGVNGDQNLLMNILQNILFYVEVNKEMHTGSEQLEAE